MLSFYLNPDKLPETYLHKEVRKVLAEVVGDDAAVQSNICSPYYYHIGKISSKPLRRFLFRMKLIT